MLDTVAEPFAQNPHVVVAAPDHFLAGRRRIAEAVMARETFIVREPGSGTRLAMQQFFDERQLVCKVGMEMASNETIKQAVMAGMGVSFLSRHTMALELQMGRLVILDVRGMPVIRLWHVAHLARKRLSPTAAAFKAFVLATAPELLRAQGGFAAP